MDPNACLAELIVCAEHLADNGVSSLRDQERAERLAALALALNDWIAFGGSLPDAFEGLFIAIDGGGFLCSACIPTGTDLDAAEVWREESDGWLGPVVCRDCKRSIPIIVNGTAPSDVAPVKPLLSSGRLMEFITTVGEYDGVEQCGTPEEVKSIDAFWQTCPDHFTLVDALWQMHDEAATREGNPPDKTRRQKGVQ